MAAGTLSNPMISRLERMDKTGAFNGAERAASYGGVALKALFLLLVTGAGVAFYFLNPVKEHGGTMFVVALIVGATSPFLAWLIRPLAPVLSILYSFCQGYVVCWASVEYAAEYQGIVFAAVGLTFLIIAAMLVLYVTGVAKLGHRFRSVITTLFFASILGSIVTFLIRFFLPNSLFVQVVFSEAGPFVIAMSVLMVLIAVLFLLSDFESIQRMVEDRMPKRFEWMAAFGLVITILWLYLKVLSLIARLTQKGRSSGGAPA